MCVFAIGPVAILLVLSCFSFLLLPLQRSLPALRVLALLLFIMVDSEACLQVATTEECF